MQCIQRLVVNATARYAECGPGGISLAECVQLLYIRTLAGWGLQLLDIALPKAFDESIVMTQAQCNYCCKVSLFYMLRVDCFR